MKFNLLKICTSVLFALVIITFVFNIYANATSADDTRFNFGNIENVEGANKLEENVTNTAIVLLTALKIICISIAVVILLIISMKYMISAPADRADIKKHAIPYVIGSVILFSTSGIIQIIQSFAGILNE